MDGDVMMTVRELDYRGAIGNLVCVGIQGTERWR